MPCGFSVPGSVPECWKGRMERTGRGADRKNRLRIEYLKMGTNFKEGPQREDIVRVITEEKSKCMRYLTFHMNLSEEDADDVFQEGCIALVENYDKGKLTKMSASLSTYLIQILKFQALNFLRSMGKTSKEDDMDRSPNIMKLESEYKEERIDELFELIVPEEDERKALLERIEPVVGDLPEPCRTLLFGRYWDNLSHQELADMLQYASANTSKTMTSRCMDKFDKRIQPLKEYKAYAARFNK